MEKEGKNSLTTLIDDEILQVNHLIKVLGRHIEKFEEAYNRRDHKEFNLLKREIIQIQRKIHSLVR